MSQEIRCKSCNKLLGEGEILHGKMTIKCKCGTMNVIAGENKGSFQDNLNLDYKETFEIKRVPDERR